MCYTCNKTVSKVDERVTLKDWIDGLAWCEHLLILEKVVPHDWFNLHSNHSDRLLDTLLFSSRIYGHSDVPLTKIKKITCTKQVYHSFVGTNSGVYTFSHFLDYFLFWPLTPLFWILPAYFRSSTYEMVSWEYSPGCRPHSGISWCCTGRLGKNLQRSCCTIMVHARRVHPLHARCIQAGEASHVCVVRFLFCWTSSGTAESPVVCVNCRNCRILRDRKRGGEDFTQEIWRGLQGIPEESGHVYSKNGLTVKWDFSIIHWPDKLINLSYWWSSYEGLPYRHSKTQYQRKSSKIPYWKFKISLNI